MLSIDVDPTVLLILLSSRCVVSESASVLKLESPVFCLIVSCAEIYKYASDHQASSLIIRLLHKRGSTVATQQHSAPKERDEGEGFTTVIYFNSCAFVSAMVFLVLLSMVLPFSKNRMTSGMNYTHKSNRWMPPFLPTNHPPRNNFPERRIISHPPPTTTQQSSRDSKFCLLS